LPNHDLVDAGFVSSTGLYAFFMPYLDVLYQAGGAIPVATAGGTMLETVLVGICLFAVLFSAICIRGFLWDARRYKHK